MSTVAQDPTRIDLEFDPREQRLFGTTHHGRKPIDVPYVSQITDDLWVGGCTNGLHLPFEIKHVISLYPWESYVGHEDVRSVLSVVMYDSLEQSGDQLPAIAAWVNACRADAPTLVHCQAGLNRSNLVAASALIAEGMAPADAIALLREKRSPAVLCNPAFEQMLLAE